MLINQFSGPYRPALSTNATDTSFPARIPAAALPSTAIRVISDPSTGGTTPNWVELLPYMTGDNDDVFAMRVIGWVRVVDEAAPSETTAFWMPRVLAELTCTGSSTIPGLAGKAVVAAELFCDTITVVTGNAGIDVITLSPTGNVVGSVMVNLKGSMYWEPTFDMTTGNPTNGNALYRYLY